VSIRFVTSNFSTKGAARARDVDHVASVCTQIGAPVRAPVEVHRRVEYPAMDFHHDAMALVADAIFIEFIL